MNKLSEYFNKNEHTLFEKEKSVTKPRKSSPKSQKSRKSTTMKHAEIRAFLDRNVDKWFSYKELSTLINANSGNVFYLYKKGDIQRVMEGDILKYSSLKSSVHKTTVTPTIAPVPVGQKEVSPKKKKPFFQKLLEALLTFFED